MPPEFDDERRRQDREDERAKVRAEDRQERRDVRAEHAVTKRADELMEAEQRKEDPLVKQLERVGSEMSFRKWTRIRFAIVGLAILFDIIASSLAIWAVITVREQSHRQCFAQNDLRKSERELWVGAVKRSPRAPLAESATQEEIDARAKLDKDTKDFLADLQVKFADVKC